MFSGLAEDQLSRVAVLVNRRSYAQGVTLFHQDMPGMTLYMIEKGSVRVFSVGLSGQEHTLNTFGPGDIFGEISSLDGRPRTASAITMNPTVVWLLPKIELEKLIDLYPAIAKSMIRVLTARIRTAASHVEAIIFQDVLGRLAYELLILSERHGKIVQNGVQVDMPLTQTDLATIVGATRESVNKALSMLRTEGLVNVDGMELTIIDPDGLRRIVQERGR